MKKEKINTNSRRLLAIMLAAIIGFSFAACDNVASGDTDAGGDVSGNTALHGKWRLEGTSSDYTVDFQANGNLVFYPAVGIPSTYTVSGSTITVLISGYPAGTATFSISGSGQDAVLTLSDTGSSGLTAGTYYRFGSGDPGDGGGDTTASGLIGKWYSSQEDADAETPLYLFEITSDWKLLLQLGLVSYDLTVSEGTITAKTTGLTLGTATFFVNGTKLTLIPGAAPNIFIAITASSNDFYKKGSTSGSDPDLEGTVSISGTASVGQTLEADISGLQGSGSVSCLWKSGGTAGTVDTIIGAGASYLLTAADLGKYITVTASRAGYSGSKTSAAIGPVAEGSDEIIVPGGSLVAKMTWLNNHAQSDTSYLVTVDTDESITSEGYNNILSYSGESDITIRLSGGAEEKTVSPSFDNPLFIVMAGVTLVLDNNIILDNDSNLAPLVVVDDGGTLTMRTGAKITSDGTHTNNGGVYVYFGGTFTMEGGEILGNRVQTYGNFTMKNGKISGSNSDKGGGVFVANGDFVMEGGEISDNIADNSGGGVYVGMTGNIAKFTMKGGKITRNRANGSYGNNGGGVVYVQSGGDFTMEGGEISANTAADRGGGVYVFQGSIFKNKNSGTIYGNDGGDNKNTATAGIGTDDKGHAVYVVLRDRCRETSAGPDVVLVSSWPDSLCGWEHLPPALTGTVTITGNAVLGETLTANTDNLDGIGDINYMWFSVIGNANWQIGWNSSTYLVGNEALGYPIVVMVNRVGYSGNVTSDPTAVVPDDRPVLTGTVTITGNAVVGQTLTANTDYLDGIGTISCEWQRGPYVNTAWKEATYTVQPGDFGLEIKVTVTREGYSGHITSGSVGPVTDPGS